MICTLLYELGDMPEAVYLADCEYGKNHVSEHTIVGYRAWATPLVKQLEKRPWLYACWRPLALRWAMHMAYKLGKPIGKRSYLIPVLGLVGLPASYILGRIIAIKAAWRAWTVYAPPVKTG